MARWLAFVIAALAFVSPEENDMGVPVESGFTETAFAQSSALSDATALAWAPDGSNRLFVALKAGGVRIIKNGVLLSTPFTTVSPVYTASECGLVGLAFDPDFATNGYVYFFVTVSSSQQQILRYTAAGDTGGGKTVLLGGLPTRGQNHDGGGIEVGPDGKLYWAIGDLGNGTGVDGDLSSFAAKVGRCNLDGTPVADNPYYDASDGISATDYIWARGFRNPFSMTFHPITGDLWVNVAGTSYEQIFLVRRDDHAGWNNYEGGNQPAGFIKPKISYVTNGGSFGGCVVGGAFYNGAAFPAEYANNFFWGDYNSGRIMRSVLDSAHENVLNTTTFVTGINSIVDVSVGPDGALYYARRGGAGTLYRLAYTGSTPQNIVLSADTLTVPEGGARTFTVVLAAPPAANVTVSVARTSGDADVTALPASLTFTPSNWSVPQTVTVSAAEDADATNDGASVTCSSAGLTSRAVSVTVDDDDPLNTAPTASITSPVNGQIMSGTNAEWYGDGIDDTGTVRAEFYVDGVLRYTDVNSAGHYHYGGDHLRWDTTVLTDGAHTLRLTVYDAGNQSGSHEITVTVANNRLFGDDFNDANADGWAFSPASGYWSVQSGELRAGGPTAGGWAWQYGAVALPSGAGSWQARVTTTATAASMQGIAVMDTGGASGVIFAVDQSDAVSWSVWTPGGGWQGWNRVGTTDRSVPHAFKIALDADRTVAVSLDGQVLASGIDAGSGWANGIALGLLYTQAESSQQVLDTRFDDVVALAGSPPLYSDDFNDGNANGWALGPPSGYWSVSGGELRAGGPTAGGWNWQYGAVVLPAGAVSWQARMTTAAAAPSTQGIVATDAGGANGIILAVDASNALLWSVWTAAGWQGWVSAGTIDRTAPHAYKILLAGDRTFTVLVDGAVRASGINAGAGWTGGIAAGLVYTQAESAGRILDARFDDVVAR